MRASRVEELNGFGMNRAKSVVNKVGDVVVRRAGTTEAEAVGVFGVDVADEMADASEGAGQSVAVVRHTKFQLWLAIIAPRAG